MCEKFCMFQSTCVFQYLRECVDMKSLENIVCVTTTDAAASEAAFQGLPQATYGETEKVKKEKSALMHLVDTL